MLKEVSDYRTLEYKCYHRLDFRVNEAGVAYVRIEFFGLLPFVVALGRIEHSEDRFNEEADKMAFFFPVGEDKIYPHEYPEEFGEMRASDDALAGFCWQRYKGAVGDGDKPVEQP